MYKSNIALKPNRCYYISQSLITDPNSPFSPKMDFVVCTEETAIIHN